MHTIKLTTRAGIQTMSTEQKSFFQTLTGILTGLASLIVALTGLYAAIGGFKSNDKAAPEPVHQVQDFTEQDRQHQLEVIKRQKEIDDLRIATEKQKLAAEQELLELKRQHELAKAALNDQEPKSFQQQKPDKVAVNVTGRWLYSNMVGNYLFVLEQDGGEVYLQEFDMMGNNVGNGQGNIRGNNLNLNWVEPYLFVTTINVSAVLQLSANGMVLSGNFSSQGNTFAVQLFKQ
jgi:hypothetical protein